MAGHQGHSAYRHHHSGAAGLAVHRKGDSCRVGCSGNIHRTGIRLCVEGPFVEEDSGIGKEHIQVHSDDTDSDDFGVISDLCPFPVQRQQTPDDMGNRPRLYPAGYFNHHRLNISGTRLLHGRLVDDNADDSLLAPICKELGVDLIWFGVYITLLVQIGQVTPPMGLNLFMVQGIDKEAKLNDIIRGVIPFLIGMLIFAVLMILFPQMTAWLPEVMGFKEEHAI